MAYPALVFLLHMDTYHAFKNFCNLVLGNEFVYCLYKFNDKKVQLKEKHDKNDILEESLHEYI